MTKEEFEKKVTGVFTSGFSFRGKRYAVMSTLNTTNTIAFEDNDEKEYFFKIGIAAPEFSKDSIANSVDELLDKCKIDGIPFKEALKDITDWKSIVV